MSLNIIVRPFEFARDFRSILWLETLQYNMLRAAGCGCVIAVVMMLMPLPPDSTKLIFVFLPLLWPLFYLFFILPLTIVTLWFSWIPFVGLFSVFLSLIGVSLGDPLVCVLKRYYPRLVPVEIPPLFSLTPVFWVLDAPEIAIAS